MKVLVSYTIKTIIKDHKVSIRQHIGAWFVELGVKIMGGNTSYKMERLEERDNG